MLLSLYIFRLRPVIGLDFLVYKHSTPHWYCAVCCVQNNEQQSTNTRYNREIHKHTHWLQKERVVAAIAKLTANIHTFRIVINADENTHVWCWNQCNEKRRLLGVNYTAEENKSHLVCFRLIAVFLSVWRKMEWAWMYHIYFFNANFHILLPSSHLQRKIWLFFRCAKSIFSLLPWLYNNKPYAL